MKVKILDINIRKEDVAQKLIINDQVPMERYVCPVCETDKYSIKYSAIKGKRDACFLEREFCSRCGHLFISWGPAREWHESYYTNLWYQGKTHGVSSRIDQLRFIKRQTQNLIKGQIDADQDLNVFIAGPLLQPGMKILEIGAGGGRSLMPFKRLGLDCYAIEPSVNSAKACEDKGIKVFNMKVEEALALKDQISGFDIVLSNHSLEHFSDPNVFLKNAVQFLKPDGIFVFNVPNKDYQDIYCETMFVLHPQVFSEKSLTYFLNKYGFEVIRKVVNHNLLFVARKSAHPQRQWTAAYTDHKDEVKQFFRQLWAERYDLKENVNKHLTVSWDASYIEKNQKAPLLDGNRFPGKGNRSFLVEMEDVDGEYAVIFESHIDNNEAFGIIK